MSIAARLVRYADLIPCKNAFVDTRTPGSDAKENFTIIGPGVSENPNQHVHIPEAHGFNIGAARQPGGCLNSQHSHETAEVFVVHSGHWAVTFGAEAGADGEVQVAPGDVLSVPIHMFRGFRKLDEGVGFLWVVLGRDDPGKVLWAPKVFDLARQYGLVLLKGGRLVDTTAGEAVPAGAELEEAPNEELVRRLATPSLDKIAACAVRLADMRGNPRSPLAGPGVEECPVITPTETRDGFAPGPITGWWPHGFNLRLLRMEVGATVPPHIRDEEEVIFVHHGTLAVTMDGETVEMAAGDTFTTPKGAARAFRALSSDGVLAFVVRGGDEAGAVRFPEQRAAAE
ncbi:cupin domain-containing protein [Muricoccus radiodurans]|uniref:cupin domain-containing protein n=1 Tax=Muricoccus radiodurans TaxID=2231721 RepID=UPI003CF49569